VAPVAGANVKNTRARPQLKPAEVDGQHGSGLGQDNSQREAGHEGAP
jgi:hypothetical protein